MSEDQFDVASEIPILRSRRGGAFRVLLWITVLLCLVGAAAYLTFNLDVFSAAPQEALPTSVSVKESLSLEEFRSQRREAVEAERSMLANIVAQQAALKQLSDQVSALSAKLEELQRTTLPPAAPVIPPVPAPRQKPGATKKPKPAGTISVGGAPLPAPTGQNER